MAMHPPEVEVVVHCADWTRHVAAAESLCRDAGAAAWRVAGAPAAGGAVAVALCDDAEVAALNARYRGHDGPTNVLSFSYGPPPAAGLAEAPPLGDIVVAFGIAAAEAAAEGRSLPDHLQRLIVHGMLHLLGYEHETPEQAEIMLRLEEQALRHLGTPDPGAPLLGVEDEQLTSG